MQKTLLYLMSPLKEHLARPVPPLKFRKNSNRPLYAILSTSNVEGHELLDALTLDSINTLLPDSLFLDYNPYYSQGSSSGGPKNSAII
jgi:hypothetical protein